MRPLVTWGHFSEGKAEKTVDCKVVRLERGWKVLGLGKGNGKWLA